MSHDDLLDVRCDKDELCDNAYVLHDLEPNICAETKHVIHIANTNDELTMLCSLNTLGYIDFDVLCNLNCLEERIFHYADLSLFSRHTYHAIGNYDNKGHYMINRVYICENLNSPFVVQNCESLEASHTAQLVIPSFSTLIDNTSILALSFVGTNLLQDRFDIHRVNSNPEAYIAAEVFEQDDTLDAEDGFSSRRGG